MDALYEERWFDAADGLRLYYRDYPNGSAQTPVLCLPGLTRNSRDFETLASAVSRTRRVVRSISGDPIRASSSLICTDSAG